MAISGNRTLTLGVEGDVTLTLPASQRYTAGTADEKVDMRIEGRVVAADTTVTIDLAASGRTFSKIREVLVINRNTATGEYVEIGGGTNDLAGLGKVKVPPKGHVGLSAPMDGLAVVADTGDTITIDPAAGKTVTVDYLILGTSA